MVRVVISVGTNIDRENNLKAALAALGRAYGALRMSLIPIRRLDSQGRISTILSLALRQLKPLQKLRPFCTASRRTRDEPDKAIGLIRGN